MFLVIDNTLKNILTDYKKVQRIQTAYDSIPRGSLASDVLLESLIDSQQSLVDKVSQGLNIHSNDALLACESYLFRELMYAVEYALEADRKEN